jgi:predicted phage-related endonuclease
MRLCLGTNFQDKFRLVGENVAKVRTDVMQEQLATFRSQLEEFARKHKVIRCPCILVACLTLRGTNC